ncbi:MAG: class II fructose-bisphosphate aldolase [Candidatus Omnitrophota bacterium]
MNLVPEQYASLQSILEEGVRIIKERGFLHIRVSEGVSIAANDELLQKLLALSPYLKKKHEGNVEKDSHGNPKLGSGGLSISEYIEAMFVELEKLRPDLYAQIKDKLNKQAIKEDYSEYVSKLTVYLAKLMPQSEPIMQKAGGYDPKKQKLSGMRNNSWGTLFQSLPWKAYPKDMKIAALSDFLGAALSAQAHKRSSVANEDTGILSDLLEKYLLTGELPENTPLALKQALEIIKPSIIIADTRKYFHLEDLADRISQVLSTEGYVNIVLPKDFVIVRNDKLLTKLFELEPALKDKFLLTSERSYALRIVFGYIPRGLSVDAWDKALAGRYAAEVSRLIEARASGGWGVFLPDGLDPKKNSADFKPIDERITLDERGKPKKKNLNTTYTPQQLKDGGVFFETRPVVVANKRFNAQPRPNFADVTAVKAALGGIVEITSGGVTITNVNLLRNELIDKLVYDATFNPNQEVVKETRKLIKDIAASLEIKPASVHNLYKEKAKDPRHYTVPAINVRGMAYDTSRAIFKAAINNNAELFILEIAKSEIGYTGQRPAEFTTSILAAAIKEGFTGPVYLQGDHFQVALKDYEKDPAVAVQSIKKLIREAIEAGFYQIDLDMSPMVDYTKATVAEQQILNYKLTAELTAYVRALERELGLDKLGIVVNLGGEIGEIGIGLDKAQQQNSTVEELRAFMNGYNATLKALSEETGYGLPGITKVAVQTGTKHGGVRDASGKIAKAKVGFNTLGELGRVAREEFGLAGVVQHGASTLPEDNFIVFAGNPVPEGAEIDEALLNEQGKKDLSEHPVAEVHLATAYQDATYDHPEFPAELGVEIKDFILNLDSTKKQIAKGDQIEKAYTDNRKHGWGPYKLVLWTLPETTRAVIRGTLELKFDTVFNNLGVAQASSALMQSTLPTGEPSLAGRASASKISETAAPDELGGIDFRSIQMLTKPMGSLSGLSFNLPKLSSSALAKVNLQEEYTQIQNMLKAGIIPSGERLKEYVAACYYKGELSSHMDEIVTCLVEIFRLEEENVVTADNATKEVMLILDVAA